MQLILPLLAATTASATSVLLPLYIWPNADGKDWQPLYDAADAHSSVDIIAIVNPDSGPGYKGPGYDAPYTAGLTHLNARPNIKTIGYVHTNYTERPADAVKHNVTLWKAYADPVSVHGIFFDESFGNNTDYLDDVVGFARQTFGQDAVMVCNFGQSVDVAYYDICDVVIPFENYMNAYRSKETLDGVIPKGKEDQAAVILHDFTGTAYDGSNADVGLIDKFLGVMKSDNVGFAHFCSAGYWTFTVAPATIGQFIASVAKLG